MESFDAAKYERLMNGLEAVEMKLSKVVQKENPTIRLDSEFVKKSFLENIAKIKNSNLGYIELEETIIEITGGATPLGADYPENGTLFLRVQNIMPNYFYLDDIVFISKEDDEVLKRSKLKKEDVLLTITGVSYGKSAVVTTGLVNANINQHSVRIQLDKNTIDPYFLSTFLNCKFGKLQSDKNITGVTRPALDYQSIKRFIISTCSVEFQLEIRKLISNSYEITRSEKSIYKQAETLLLDKLGLHNWQPTKANAEVKSFKNSFLQSGRLDAEYYQPKYDELIEKLQATGRSVSLGELLTYNQRGTQPVYTETAEGLPVLNSKHIRKNRIDFVDNRYAYREFTNKNSIIRKGDVLINGTGVGTIGRAAPYLLDSESLPDNHVTILRSDSIDPVFLSVMLNSIIGSMQVDKFYKGSSGQIELYPNDIAAFIIWNAPTKVQQSIRHCIEEANRLEQQSQHLLQVAKQAVEMAIEQSEEAAMEFIKSQTT